MPRVLRLASWRGRRPLVAGVLAGLLLVGVTVYGTTRSSAAQLGDINHIVVVYMENWSFDSLYGKFPGADGIANAGTRAAQVDKNGLPYTVLPQPLDSNNEPKVAQGAPPAVSPPATLH